MKLLSNKFPQTVPPEMDSWMNTETARGKLRGGDFTAAFEEGKVLQITNLSQSALAEVKKQQVALVESAQSIVLSQVDDSAISVAVERLLPFFADFQQAAAGYTSEIVGPMSDLHQTVALTDDCAAAVKRVSDNRRREIYRAFMFHATSKLGLKLVERAESVIAAKKWHNSRKKSCKRLLVKLQKS